MSVYAGVVWVFTLVIVAVFSLALLGRFVDHWKK